MMLAPRTELSHLNDSQSTCGGCISSVDVFVSAGASWLSEDASMGTSASSAMADSLLSLSLTMPRISGTPPHNDGALARHIINNSIPHSKILALILPPPNRSVDENLSMPSRRGQLTVEELLYRGEKGQI